MIESSQLDTTPYNTLISLIKLLDPIISTDSQCQELILFLSSPKGWTLLHTSHQMIQSWMTLSSNHPIPSQFYITIIRALLILLSSTRPLSNIKNIEKSLDPYQGTNLIQINLPKALYGWFNSMRKKMERDGGWAQESTALGFETKEKDNMANRAVQDKSPSIFSTFPDHSDIAVEDYLAFFMLDIISWMNMDDLNSLQGMTCSELMSMLLTSLVHLFCEEQRYALVSIKLIRTLGHLWMLSYLGDKRVVANDRVDVLRNTKPWLDVATSFFEKMTDKNSNNNASFILLEYLQLVLTIGTYFNSSENEWKPLNECDIFFKILDRMVEMMDQEISSIMQWVQIYCQFLYIPNWSSYEHEFNGQIIVYREIKDDIRVTPIPSPCPSWFFKYLFILYRHQLSPSKPRTFILKLVTALLSHHSSTVIAIQASYFDIADQPFFDTNEYIHRKQILQLGLMWINNKTRIQQVYMESSRPSTLLLFLTSYEIFTSYLHLTSIDFASNHSLTVIPAFQPCSPSSSSFFPKSPLLGNLFHDPLKWANILNNDPVESIDCQIGILNLSKEQDDLLLIESQHLIWSILVQILLCCTQSYWHDISPFINGHWIHIWLDSLEWASIRKSKVLNQRMNEVIRDELDKDNVIEQLVVKLEKIQEKTNENNCCTKSRQEWIDNGQISEKLNKPHIRPTSYCPSLLNNVELIHYLLSILIKLVECIRFEDNWPNQKLNENWVLDQLEKIQCWPSIESTLSHNENENKENVSCLYHDELREKEMEMGSRNEKDENSWTSCELEVEYLDILDPFETISSSIFEINLQWIQLLCWITWKPMNTLSNKSEIADTRYESMDLLSSSKLSWIRLFQILTPIGSIASNLDHVITLSYWLVQYSIGQTLSPPIIPSFNPNPIDSKLIPIQIDSNPIGSTLIEIHLDCFLLPLRFLSWINFESHLSDFCQLLNTLSAIWQQSIGSSVYHLMKLGPTFFASQLQSHLQQSLIKQIDSFLLLPNLWSLLFQLHQFSILPNEIERYFKWLIQYPSISAKLWPWLIELASEPKKQENWIPDRYWYWDQPRKAVCQFNIPFKDQVDQFPKKEKKSIFKDQWPPTKGYTISLWFLYQLDTYHQEDGFDKASQSISLLRIEKTLEKETMFRFQIMLNKDGSLTLISTIYNEHAMDELDRWQCPLHLKSNKWIHLLLIHQPDQSSDPFQHDLMALKLPHSKTGKDAIKNGLVTLWINGRQKLVFPFFYNHFDLNRIEKMKDQSRSGHSTKYDHDNDKLVALKRDDLDQKLVKLIWLGDNDPFNHFESTRSWIHCSLSNLVLLDQPWLDILSILTLFNSGPNHVGSFHPIVHLEKTSNCAHLQDLNLSIRLSFSSCIQDIFSLPLNSTAKKDMSMKWSIDLRESSQKTEDQSNLTDSTTLDRFSLSTNSDRSTLSSLHLDPCFNPFQSITMDFPSYWHGGRLLYCERHRFPNSLVSLGGLDFLFYYILQSSKRIDDQIHALVMIERLISWHHGLGQQYQDGDSALILSRIIIHLLPQIQGPQCQMLTETIFSISGMKWNPIRSSYSDLGHDPHAMVMIDILFNPSCWTLNSRQLFDIIFNSFIDLTLNSSNESEASEDDSNWISWITRLRLKPLLIRRDRTMIILRWLDPKKFKSLLNTNLHPNSFHSLVTEQVPIGHSHSSNTLSSLDSSLSIKIVNFINLIIHQPPYQWMKQDLVSIKSHLIQIHPSRILSAHVDTQMMKHIENVTNLILSLLIHSLIHDNFNPRIKPHIEACEPWIHTKLIKPSKQSSYDHHLSFDTLLQLLDTPIDSNRWQYFQLILVQLEKLSTSAQFQSDGGFQKCGHILIQYPIHIQLLCIVFSYLLNRIVEPYQILSFNLKNSQGKRNEGKDVAGDGESIDSGHLFIIETMLILSSTSQKCIVNGKRSLTKRAKYGDSAKRLLIQNLHLLTIDNPALNLYFSQIGNMIFMGKTIVRSALTQKEQDKYNESESNLDGINSNQHNSIQSNSNQFKSNGINSNQLNSVQSKLNQFKLNQSNPTQSNSIQIKTIVLNLLMTLSLQGFLDFKESPTDILSRILAMIQTLSVEASIKIQFQKEILSQIVQFLDQVLHLGDKKRLDTWIQVMTFCIRIQLCLDLIGKKRELIDHINPYTHTHHRSHYFDLQNQPLLEMDRFILFPSLISLYRLILFTKEDQYSRWKKWIFSWHKMSSISSSWQQVKFDMSWHMKLLTHDVISKASWDLIIDWTIQINSNRHPNGDEWRIWIREYIFATMMRIKQEVEEMKVEFSLNSNQSILSSLIPLWESCQSHISNLFSPKIRLFSHVRYFPLLLQWIQSIPQLSHWFQLENILKFRIQPIWLSVCYDPIFYQWFCQRCDTLWSMNQFQQQFQLFKSSPSHSLQFEMDDIQLLALDLLAIRLVEERWFRTSWRSMIQQMTNPTTLWSIPTSSITWILDKTEDHCRRRWRLKPKPIFKLILNYWANQHEMAYFDPLWRFHHFKTTSNHTNQQLSLSSKNDGISPTMSWIIDCQHWLNLLHPDSDPLHLESSILDNEKLDNPLSDQWMNSPLWSLPIFRIRDHFQFSIPSIMIKPNQAIEGSLLFGQSYLTFYSGVYQNRKDENEFETTTEVVRKGFKSWIWPWNEIQRLDKKRYALIDDSLEILTIRGRSYFFHFPSMEQEQFTEALIRQYWIKFKSHINGTDTSIISLSLDYHHICRFGSLLYSIQEELDMISIGWKRGLISNFDYLIMLNTLGGRTYNNLTQYFIFPHIIADYEHDELDLNNPNTFRNLKVPMGAQDLTRLDKFLKKYELLVELNEKPYHYGSHYSNMVAVLYYLIRLYPFTALFLEFQSGKLDLPDRIFNSIAQTWQLSSSQSLTDVKELIPEFYYLPEYLTNPIQPSKFGCKQDGTIVNHVLLPPWANQSPQEYIQKHIEALESIYVSSHLHHWIDLIFGYKQIGEEARKSNNLFHPYTYSGSINIDEIEIPLFKKAVAMQIQGYGQTPRKLFKKPHPRKEINQKLIKEAGGIKIEGSHQHRQLKSLSTVGKESGSIGGNSSRYEMKRHEDMDGDGDGDWLIGKHKLEGASGSVTSITESDSPIMLVTPDNSIITHTPIAIIDNQVTPENSPIAIIDNPITPENIPITIIYNQITSGNRPITITENPTTQITPIITPITPTTPNTNNTTLHTIHKPNNLPSFMIPRIKLLTCRLCPLEKANWFKKVVTIKDLVLLLPATQEPIWPDLKYCIDWSALDGGLRVIKTRNRALVCVLENDGINGSICHVHLSAHGLVILVGFESGRIGVWEKVFDSIRSPREKREIQYQFWKHVLLIMKRGSTQFHPSNQVNQISLSQLDPNQPNPNQLNGQMNEIKDWIPSNLDREYWPAPIDSTLNDDSIWKTWIEDPLLKSTENNLYPLFPTPYSNQLYPSQDHISSPWLPRSRSTMIEETHHPFPDGRQWRKKTHLSGHLSPITCLHIDIMSQVFLSGDEDGKVIMWDINQFKMIRLLWHSKKWQQYCEKVDLDQDQDQNQKNQNNFSSLIMRISHLEIQSNDHHAWIVSYHPDRCSSTIAWITLNGDFIKSRTNHHRITSLAITKNQSQPSNRSSLIITGDDQGMIKLWKARLTQLELIQSWHLDPITLGVCLISNSTRQSKTHLHDPILIKSNPITTKPNYNHESIKKKEFYHAVFTPITHLFITKDEKQFFSWQSNGGILAQYTIDI